jgi:hypothetical protein
MLLSLPVSIAVMVDSSMSDWEELTVVTLDWETTLAAGPGRGATVSIDN